MQNPRRTGVCCLKLYPPKSKAGDGSFVSTYAGRQLQYVNTAVVCLFNTRTIGMFNIAKSSKWTIMNLIKTPKTQ